MAVSLPNFPSFHAHAEGNAGPRWEKWLVILERMSTGITTIPKQKRALLLRYAGPDVMRYSTLCKTPEKTKLEVELHINPDVTSRQTPRPIDEFLSMFDKT